MRMLAAYIFATLSALAVGIPTSLWIAAEFARSASLFPN